MYSVMNAHNEEDLSSAAVVDVQCNRFPFCVVWGPLPLLSWLCPLIGHMAICDSRGRVHDFAGSYFIGVDNFMTGAVCRYARILPEEVSEETAKRWDEAIENADEEFRQRVHNLCCNNCHDHTLMALQEYGLRVPGVALYTLRFLLYQSRFVNAAQAVRLLLPFIIIVAVVLACVLLF
ncbi:MAG: hypothetical protein MHM6MM_005813 [Cercozoa sp. M6MM]